MTPRASTPEAMVERLVERIRLAAGAAAGFDRQIEAGLRELLGALAADPELARVALIEPRASGRTGYRTYQRALGRLAAALERAATEAAGGEPPPHTARAVVVGLAALITREVDEGRREGLMGLLPELVFLTVSPFAGTETAEEAMRRCRED